MGALFSYCPLVFSLLVLNCDIAGTWPCKPAVVAAYYVSLLGEPGLAFFYTQSTSEGIFDYGKHNIKKTSPISLY